MTQAVESDLRQAKEDGQTAAKAQQHAEDCLNELQSQASSEARRLESLLAQVCHYQKADLGACHLDVMLHLLMHATFNLDWLQHLTGSKAILYIHISLDML